MTSLIVMLRNFLDTRSGGFVVALSLALVVAVGSADYFTGYFLSFGLFYVAPIALVAWYVSRTAGAALALLSTLVWYCVNSVFTPPELGREILIWNSAIRFGFFIVISLLLSSLKEAYARQKDLARTDLLTGLLNRRAFEDHARIELIRASRSRNHVAVFYLDLDNFKALNDSRGHAAGDGFLRQVGTVLRSSLRSTDFVGRLGGDEFAVLLAGTSEAQVRETASRLQAAVLHVAGDLGAPVSVTIGVATSDGSDDIESLIKRADDAMYRGKASTKGSIMLDLVPGDA